MKALIVACVVIGALLLYVGACLLGGLIFQFLWNAFVPAAFNGPNLGYWTATAGWFLILSIGGIIGRK